MTALLQQMRAAWEREVFWIGIDGELIWPRPGYRSFAEWLAEDVRLDRDDGGDDDACD